MAQGTCTKGGNGYPGYNLKPRDSPVYTPHPAFPGQSQERQAPEQETVNPGCRELVLQHTSAPRATRTSTESLSSEQQNVDPASRKTLTSPQDGLWETGCSAPPHRTVKKKLLNIVGTALSWWAHKPPNFSSNQGLEEFTQNMRSALSTAHTARTPWRSLWKRREELNGLGA